MHIRFKNYLRRKLCDRHSTERRRKKKKDAEKEQRTRELERGGCES
jgi:hypothetical protein